MARTITDTQILKAALNIIAKEGYAGATTRQIASEAGINEVTLFRRFGNKKSLLIAVIEQEAESLTTSGINYTGDIQADLIRVVQFYHHLIEHRGHVVMMMMSEIPRQPELKEAMQIPFSILKKVSALIERYQEEGSLVAEPTMQAVTGLLGGVFLRGILGVIHTPQTEPFEANAYVTQYLQGRLRN